MQPFFFTMKAASRSLYHRVQSSSDDDDGHGVDGREQPSPRENETVIETKASSACHEICSSSSRNEDEDDGDNNNITRIEDDLKALQAHRATTARERGKKTVLTEITGKAPPGRDGIYVLNRTAVESLSSNPAPNPNPDARPDGYLRGSMLSTERLIDMRKLAPLSPGVRRERRSALDRVMRLQERAGVGDVNSRFQERRDRCFGRVRYGSGKGGARGLVSAASSVYQDVVAGEPTVEVDASREGVLKVSDRSFCENGEDLLVAVAAPKHSGCEALLRIIKKNDKLVELDLSGCNIYKGDELAQIVRSATSLKRLSLEWNSLGLARTGISALFSAISSNRSIKEVDLRSNRIGLSTAAALAHALQCNYSLTCLDLRWNEIGPGGAAAIMAMLQRNHSLTEIRLVGNGIPPSIQTEIDELLEKNRQGKLFQPAAIPPLDNRPFPESDLGLYPRFNSKDTSDINLERIASLQKEIDTCRVELYEVQLQKVATDTQLETVRVELKEENLLRKFIEKETGDFKSQMNLSKQQVQDLEDKLKRNDQTAATKIAVLNSEVMEAREKGHQAQVTEAEARRENNHLKDQMARIQADCKARMEATEERAKNDIDYKTSIIKRLESEMAQKNLKQKEEVDSLRSKLTAQIKNLEIARDFAIQETERQKCALMQCETQLATKEQCFQNEKETAQKVFDGKINTMKAETTTLRNQLEASNLEQQKVKKKHASTVEEYESRIAHLTSSLTKLEVTKSRFDEEMMATTTEQSKLQERLKARDNKLREMESKMEAERVKHAQALAHEVAKHLEDRKSLENEVLATRRQIEVVHLHVKEIQSEQERRKFDTERRVTGAETAVLEWIHQQFASLKSALIVQHSVAGVG